MPQHNLFRLKLLVFLAVLLAGAWFYSPGSWNAAARYDSIYALAEEGTFAIDTYITNPKKNVNTGDWSRHDGHYYSSKAPGNMFIGAAAYAPFYWGGRMLGVKHNVHLDLFYGWWINFWCSAVPLALGALCMLLLLLDWGFSPVRSTFWALCFALATPLFPYCTQLWGHPMAAAFLAVAFYASWKAKPSHVLAGFAVGWAVLADYAAAFALPALALPLLRAKDWRGTLKTALGGVLPLALFLWYHWVCFGSPVTIGNAYANPVFLQSEGAGGMMTRFSTLTFWKLLFGTQRGLIWNAPLLILAFPGAAALWRRNRWLAAGLAFTILAGCLSNSAYGYWDSGASVTARFLIYSLPAWIIFAAHWQTRTAPRQILALLLALWSFLNMFTVANISPTISTKRYSPLLPDAYWMCYRDGAWNRARSRGLKLYYWQKETKKISREAALSPGRLLFGHTPWSDIILFSGVAALLYFTLLRRELNAAARLKQWGREVREILQRNRHHLRSPWLYVTAAGALLLIIFPGASPWGILQHNLVV
ncbi:MAG: hypothetical protein J6S21_01245, partial [Victivallales bacterium]|nr:hypothetical protein [Victivallales bacterium]